MKWIKYSLNIVYKGAQNTVHFGAELNQVTRHVFFRSEMDQVHRIGMITNFDLMFGNVYYLAQITNVCKY